MKLTTECPHNYIFMPVGQDGLPIRTMKFAGYFPSGEFCQYCLRPRGLRSLDTRAALGAEEKANSSGPEG